MCTRLEQNKAISIVKLQELQRAFKFSLERLRYKQQEDERLRDDEFFGQCLKKMEDYFTDFEELIKERKEEFKKLIETRRDQDAQVDDLIKKIDKNQLTRTRINSFFNDVFRFSHQTFYFEDKERVIARLAHPEPEPDEVTIKLHEILNLLFEDLKAILDYKKLTLRVIGLAAMKIHSLTEPVLIEVCSDNLGESNAKREQPDYY
jgi:transcription termination factor NusB